MKKKLLAGLLASLMTVSFLVGCGSNNTENVTDDNTQKTEESEKTEETTNEEETTVANSTPRNETLYFNGQQWGTINNWNPMSANSNNAMAIQQVDSARVLIYETLFLYNMLDGSLQPLLGESYEWNADQSQLTIKLNPAAKWSDGTKVTAEDVVYTFDTHVKYGSTTGNDYSAYIEKVEAKDDTTVVFNSKLDDAGVPINPLKVIEYLPKVYVMQKAYLQTVEARNNNEADKVKEDVMDDLVASGPYKPYYDDDQKVVFIRDDNYWGTSLWGSLPAPKYIAHTIFADNAAGDIAFANGEVDVSQQFVSEIWKMWEGGKPISTYIDDAPYYVCATMPTAFFNVERRGLDKAEVRKAIAMAVDFDQIISTAMSGYSPTFKDVPRSLMNPTAAEQALVDQAALSDLQFTGKDIEGANKLLDEAGVVDTDGDGIREIDGENLSYKAECPEGWSDWNASLEIVAAAGKEIGINIETYFPDANTFYDDMTTGNFDICMWSPPGASISNPWTRSMALLSSTYNELEVNWSGNFGGFTSEKADEILAKIPTEQDQAKLKEYYTELSKIYLEEVPSFSLMYRPQVFHTVNESVWTGFPQQDDGNNIPPLDCTDGYGVAALYHLKNIE
ncbi:ABC transporter substrate-binding protein [Clostridium sp. NSJ-6]|uniref:ABC transporter substrate-binding protein n=1 Tax=Clostridium hominis TaxID=2763036 RepID=A0ABR7DDI0_9CLOT|nr:ABC transporter substrate-binding protein [Clostridium hominis]MBC5629469.1 ABC transporter substrate-binding protein [Clostridium hominis]MDU2670516.1 ABC transporter substrate-binding protein [Clostridium sp.]